MSTEGLALDAETKIALLEAENRRLRSQFHDTIERVTDAFYAVDRDWRLTFVNTPAALLLRKPADALLGRSLWEEYPAAVGTIFFEQFHQAMREQQPVVFEACYAPFDTWFTVRAYPSPDGLAVFFQEITQQVTARKQLEDANDRLSAQSCEIEMQMEEMSEQRDHLERLMHELAQAHRETERRAAILQAIFASTHACLALLDRDFTFLMVNAAYCENSGHAEAELIGKNHFALFPYGENQALFTRVRETGAPYIANERPFEYLDQPERGITYWNWILAPIPDAEGRTQGLLLSLTDVTPQVRARQQMEQLADRVERRAAELEAAFTAVADGLIVYGPNAEILRMNPAATEMIGYSPEELRLTLAERLRLLHAEDADGNPFPLERMPVQRALRGETVHGEVMLLHRPNGPRVYVSVSAAPITTAEGTRVGAVASYTDITRQREQQELQKTFLHMVSHDLRSPMAVINGHAGLLHYLLEDAQGNARQSLQAIQRSIRRMDVMIEDLVDAARLEGRQYHLKCQPVDLASFITDLLERTRTAYDVARIRVAVPSHLPPIAADHDRLERILLNLLSNALKYSRPETAVEIAARRQDDMVVIAVTDQGEGIKPEEQARLFQRFYRASNRKAEGIGLGLYITKLLVEAHGGHIRVDSEPGKGSTFTVTLPVAG